MLVICLASESRFKKQALENALKLLENPATLKCQGAYLDEESFMSSFPTEPETALLRLAEAKARAVYEQNAISEAEMADLYIATDQVVSYTDERGVKIALGKSGTLENAFNQLRTMSPGWCDLWNGCCLLTRNGACECWIETARLHFRELTDAEIHEYLAKDPDALYCCGSFVYEQHGADLFDEIVCDDLSIIQGLGKSRVLSLITDFRCVI